MTAANWGILEVEGVMSVAEAAAGKVCEEWNGVVEYEDLLQEAYIYLATKPGLANALELGGLKLLHHGLWCDLTNFTNGQNLRTKKNESYEAITEGVME